MIDDRLLLTAKTRIAENPAQHGERSLWVFLEHDQLGSGEAAVSRISGMGEAKLAGPAQELSL